MTYLSWLILFSGENLPVFYIWHSKEYVFPQGVIEYPGLLSHIDYSTKDAHLSTIDGQLKQQKTGLIYFYL